ncbi:MAG: WG repeat-containing protein, partial [Tidjanibacter sp.]|nr:WG repeat-containing protein [Tidjanibacter sp.]
MKKLFLLVAIMAIVLPTSTSAQNLKPELHPKKGVYGYWGVKKNGKESFVIKPQFEKASQFAGGHAFVCKNGVWFIIDSDGMPVSDITYTNVELKTLREYKHLYRVWRGNKCGVVDLETCEEMLIVEYDNITYSLRTNQYRIHLNGRQGVADVKGVVIIPIK